MPPGLPCEVILLIAEHLQPCDQLSLLRVVPELTRLFTFRHLQVQDQEKNTIFHLVAERGESRLLRGLLKSNSIISNFPYVRSQASPLTERHCVPVDLENYCGRTPLSFAAGNGHEAVVRLLVDRKDVEANSRDHYGRTPLLHAALGGHEAVVKLLIERDDVHADSEDYFRKRTPLSLAAANGHEAVVKLLVGREDVNVNSKDMHGMTPLAHAVSRNNVSVVEFLLRQDDVDIELIEGIGRTSMLYAAERGHEAALLMNRKAN